MEVVKINANNALKAAGERITVTLVSDYGQHKAGEEITCHPALVPMLQKKGVVISDDTEEAAGDVEEVKDPETPEVPEVTEVKEEVPEVKEEVSETPEVPEVKELDAFEVIKNAADFISAKEPKAKK